VCFDIASFIVGALACVLFDETDAESIITSLKTGDLVLFRDKRYRWCGVELKDGKRTSIILEQDGFGKNGNTTLWIPFDANKSLIRPYYGASELTDGRGIKRKGTNRIDFISQILGVKTSEIPSITGVSVVIVAERGLFDRLFKGIRIVYGNGKSIDLLDIVTASYFSDSGEEYQYGSNPAKTEPVIKITSKISTARSIVLNKRWNDVIGLIIIGDDAAVKGSSELTDLLGRKRLKFVHISAGIDSKFLKDLVKSQEEAAVFACTKEFLLRDSFAINVKNDLTIELSQQIENIISNSLTTKIVDGGCSWEELRKVKEALYTIKKSGWNDDAKNSFLFTSLSLLNLLMTAVFPIGMLERIAENGKLNAEILSPAKKICDLRILAETSGTMKNKCDYIIDVLDRLYRNSYFKCPKHEILKQYLDSSVRRKTAVVVPKTYYIDIITADEEINIKDVTIVTVNHFNRFEQYDEIIVVGDISGKQFDPFNYKTAANITVLLYECETHWFIYKKRKSVAFEKKLNSRLGVFDNGDTLDDIDLVDEIINNGDMDTFADKTVDLESYARKIGLLDIRKFAARTSTSIRNTFASGVYAIGRFVSGEQILFSKYYNAVVFDPVNGVVTETSVDELSVGDKLIFVKRDDYTRNMVDYIYESLQKAGLLSAEILDATEKSVYWKEALREYKNKHGLSYKDISKQLQKLGSSIQEVTIRQWLIEESHIIGPRDEITLQQIAQLTQDFYLLRDTHSYFEACRIVRHQRKQILGIIGEAITDKLSGHKPPKGGIFEVVYNNVENLSETLELEEIVILEEPVNVPAKFINKPIQDWEVAG